MRILALDTETTGLDPRHDRLLEIGWVEAAGAVDVGCGATLVRPGRAVPPAVQRITGLSDDVVALGVGEDAALAIVLPLIARVDAVVAWNAAFDRAFVAAAAARCGVSLPEVPWLCALALARQRRPGLPNHRLASVAAVVGVDPGRSHRALDDARCVLAVWRALHPPSSTSSAEVVVRGPRCGTLTLFD